MQVVIPETFDVLENEKAMNGEWSVRVVISEEEARFFGFRQKEQPTQEQIDIEAQLSLLADFTQALLTQRAQLAAGV